MEFRFYDEDMNEWYKSTNTKDEGGDAEALKKALIGLKDAFVDVLDACDYEKEFNSKYPFGKCFLELTHDVIAWVESEVM